MGGQGFGMALQSTTSPDACGVGTKPGLHCPVRHDPSEDETMKAYHAEGQCGQAARNHVLGQKLVQGRPFTGSARLTGFGFWVLGIRFRV